MTAKQFNAMKSLDNKADLVWDIGMHVDERIIYNKYIIKMYSIYSFFVEVWIDVKTLKIDKIQALENSQDWQGYLKSIRLEDLITS